MRKKIQKTLSLRPEVATVPLNQSVYTAMQYEKKTKKQIKTIAGGNKRLVCKTSQQENGKNYAFRIHKHGVEEERGSQ